ncbi:hypothetical protein [Lacipirellula sp.]|uniref:hypothetical protein n=1 Tax=Lacipirellula sp. TaxID=2691419 RepID=UPI003D13A529
MIYRSLVTAAIVAAFLARPISAATVDLTTATMAGPDAHLHGSLSDEGLINPGAFSILKSAATVSELRGYLVFNLGGIQGQVTKAELLLPNGTLTTQGQQEGFATLVLHDFYAPVNEILTHPTEAMFDDLGTGILYGESSEFSTSAPAATMRTIALDSTALVAINSPHDGKFMMGVSISSAGQQAPWFRWINYTRDIRNLTLRLTLVPEPAAGLLAVSPLIGVASVRRTSIA